MRSNLSVVRPVEDNYSSLFGLWFVGNAKCGADYNIVFLFRAECRGQDGLANLIIFQKIGPFWGKCLLVKNKQRAYIGLVVMSIVTVFKLLSTVLWC